MTKPTRITAKVSHTISTALHDRLENLAFHQKVSESSVVEYALSRFFREGSDEELGRILRENGARRRRAA